MAARFLHRFAIAAALATLLAGIAAALLYAIPLPLQREIDVTAARHWDGNAYALPISDYLPTIIAGAVRRIESDSDALPMASRLRLLEQGRQIGVPHSIHAEIAASGGGRYSHWGRDLVFSASDNSDPRTNKRTYVVEFPFAPVWWIPLGLLLAGGAGLSVLLPTARFLHRIAVAAALATVVAGIAAAFLYAIPLPVQREIDVTAAKHWDGSAYALAVSDYLPTGIAEAVRGVEPDSDATPFASRLRLLEQGRRIGVPHSIHAEIAASGGGRYSHLGRDLVFSASDNSDPRTNKRIYAIEFPFSLAWWIPLGLLLVGSAALSLLFKAGHDGPTVAKRGAVAQIQEVFRFLTRNSSYAFWAGAAMLCLYLNLVFALLLPAPVPYPDSNGYLALSLFRTVGYPFLLDAYQLFFKNWEYLPLVQLNLLLAGLLLLAGTIARVTGSSLVAWLFLALVVGAGNMVLSAADILTEAAFSAFTMMHLAFAILYFDRQRLRWGLLAGVALAAAILVKSVAVVLLGPLLLFIAFLPGMRRSILVLMLCPALTAWFVPSAFNFARNGVFESSLAGSYALAGHVAWAIRPQPGSPNAEEAGAIERRLRPVLQGRPPTFDSVDAYVDFTAREYNTLLWANIVPELAARYADACSPDFFSQLNRCRWNSCKSACVPKINRTLLQLSREAIAANPVAYGRHVLAHGYGMWRDVFTTGTDVLHGIERRADSLPAAYDPAVNSYRDLLGPLPPLPDPMERAAAIARFEDAEGSRLLDLIALRDLAEFTGQHVIHRHPFIMFVLGLVASLLVFRLPKLSSAAKAYCYTGLALNACILGTSLSQPSLARYAWTLQGVMAAMLLLGLAVAGRRIAAAIRTMPVRRRAPGNLP